MMELNSKSEKKAQESTSGKVGLLKESQVSPGIGIVGSVDESASSDNGVFVSVKSINISGSEPDLPSAVVECGLDIHNVPGSIEGNGNGDGDKGPFNVPDIKSETRVLVPRGCSDSHIGEGEGFHSSRLSSSASHGSLSSAVFLAVGISEEGGILEAKNALVVVDNVQSGNDKREECQSGNETTENVNTELGESLSVQQASSSTASLGNTSGKGKEKTLLTIPIGIAIEEDVRTEPEETDIDLDTDLSIQVEHDLSVGNTEDFLDEELLDEYDEPDDELHRELEQIFESDFQQGAGEGGGESGKKKSKKSSTSPSVRHKRSKYVDSATWTQEDDMPSPLSDLSPVQSPVKKKNSRSSGKRSTGVGGGASENSSHHQAGGQFDHQYQYQSYRGVVGGHRSRHQPSSGRSHQHSSRGIHQSQTTSNQRFGGVGSGEFIHHQPQQHHSHSGHPLPECFTVSSQLLSREARLYENVPTTPGELETLEILLTGGENYPTSSGGGGSGRNSKGNASHRNSHKNNGGGSSGSGGSSSTTNNNHLLHHHHHSASNLNSPGGVGSHRNSVEQLFSVSELLGPGSCLAVGGGGCGPPSRTSWVDSGRESLSFDGENNNSGGSSRNLLLIPPPPPPPINYQGFTNSSLIMQNHHHVSSTQSPSHSHSQAHSSRKSGGSRRLVRQKHAIDETFLPIPTNSTDNLGIDQGGMGGCGGGSGYLAIPSPRRGAPGMISNNMIAANFAGIAASPISLQRHPPASQIMLQENKKNKPLMPCESPYGIISGGTGDWSYGGDGRGTDKKGGQLSRDLLRCRSPQRGRLRGKNSHNQSFDYGELPSHQMFPKRHLLTSRQLSSHNGHHAGFPAGSSSNQVGNNNSAFILQQQNQHRSFPAGLFSGMTPKSCSMGDLTSSTASPNNQPHHNYQSFHGNGKASDQIALCPSGNALIGSLPLPPQTSVTYEFSLAPQSGTLAPGWNLTAVQRGLATAVPLAAAVARRRLPRPRTTRPRFGFTDKNEARRAKWTIVGTALTLLFISMLLVAITLKMAPLIDDMGLSSTSSDLSSPNKMYLSGGDSPGFSHVCMDPYARRPSGAASSIIRSSGNNPAYFFSNSREHLPTSSPKLDSSRVRRSQGDIDIKRQISATLSIPSRENSVKSTSSKSTSGGQSSPVVILPPANTFYGCSTPMSIVPNAILSPHPTSSGLLLNNNLADTSQHFYLAGGSPGSSNCLAPTSVTSPSRGGSRSSSIAQSGTGSHHRHRDEAEAHMKHKRQRKYVIGGFTFLVLVAVACVVISLGLSSQVEIPGVDIGFPFVNDTISDDDLQVRKENENLMRVIQQTSPSINNMTQSNSTNSSTPAAPLLIEDQDESSGNYNINNNLNGGKGQSLTRSVITVDPGPGPRSSDVVGFGLEKADREVTRRNESADSSGNLNRTNNSAGTPPPIPRPPLPLDFDRDRDESGTLSSSLIAEILLSSSRSKTVPDVTQMVTDIGPPTEGGGIEVDSIANKDRDKFSLDVMMADASSASATLLLGNSETSINAETPNIYTEQIISDSDVDRVRTSIVLR